MIKRYEPTLWRERAATQILRADCRKRQRPQRPSPAKTPASEPTLPRRYTLSDLPQLRKRGLLP